MTTVSPVSQTIGGSSKELRLFAAARKLEANFLAEVFKSAGVGEARESFDGGPGEDHFTSFLVQEYADAAVAAGGIGLAENIYHSMVQRESST